MNELARRTAAQPSCHACIHLGLAELETALERLEKAVERCDGWTIHLYVDSIHDPLRLDPRFAALLRSMNLLP